MRGPISPIAPTENPLFHTASWATVGASTGRVIAAAPLHGLPQTIGRAEMVAIIAGLEWCYRFGQLAHVWCDSLFVAKGLATLITLGDIPAHWEHFDLWFRMLTLLEMVPLEASHIHWIPSHLDPLLCESPFESWVAQWNAVVDRVAVQVNLQRSSWFWQQLSEAQEIDKVWVARIEALRKFYFKVADVRKLVEAAPLIFITDADLVDGKPLNSFFFHGWQSFCSDAACSHLPLSFGVQIDEWLFDLEQAHDGVYVQISFLELTFLISSEALIPFPFRESRRNSWAYQFPRQRLERPTLSYLFRMVRPVLLACFAQLDFCDLVCKNLNRTELGIHYPVDGVGCILGHGLYSMLQNAIRKFTSTRPIRKSRDLARPI